MPKISSSPLIFGAGALYSLTQTIHLPTDDVIQLHYAVDVSTSKVNLE
jgi:hypothetical protein